MEHTRERPRQKGHDSVLRHGTDEDIHRAREHDTEIFERKCQTHREHDETENDRGTLSLLHPTEEVGEEIGHHSRENDEKAGVAGEYGRYFLKHYNND